MQVLDVGANVTADVLRQSIIYIHEVEARPSIFDGVLEVRMLVSYSPSLPRSFVAL